MDADRMRMTQQHIPAGQSIENQPSVNVICYEYDGMSKFLFFFPDQYPQLIQGLLRINHSGRIVRGIDDDDFCLRIQCRIKCFQVELKGVGGLHGFQYPSVIGRIGSVFHKKRGRSEHFISGIKQGFHHHIQSTPGPDTHHRILGLEIQSGFLVQFLCHISPGSLKTGIRHVSVHTGSRITKNFLQLPVNLLRRFEDRIS